MPEKRDVGGILRRSAVIGAALKLGPLRRWWEERKRRAVPEGSITFHLGLGNEERLLQRLDEAVELIERLGLDALHILHGTAVMCRAGALVVSGPPGVGKSTVLRSLAERDVLEVLEDGLVLVGQRGDRWSMIESGVGPLLERMSRISLMIRTFLCLRGTSFAKGKINPSLARSRIDQLLVDRPAYRLAVLTASFQETPPVSLREIPLAAAAFAEPDRGFMPHATVTPEGQMSSWRETPSWVGVRVLTYACTDGRQRVMARIEDMAVSLCAEGEHGSSRSEVASSAEPR